MSADTPKRPVKARRTPPRQPDYQDEILKEQLDAICHLTDPEGKHASDRVLIYPGAWGRVNRRSTIGWIWYRLWTRHIDNKLVSAHLEE